MKKKILPVIRYTNNWESERYFFGCQELTPKNCKSIHIQWPDSSEEDVPIIWKEVCGQYGDMGQVYNFSRKEMFININYKGLKHEINLKEILTFKRIKD